MVGLKKKKKWTTPSGTSLPRLLLCIVKILLCIIEILSSSYGGKSSSSVLFQEKCMTNERRCLFFNGVFGLASIWMCN